MDKQKIIKIGVAVLIGICAIVYYIISQNQENTYDDILTNTTVTSENVVQNETKEEKISTIKVYVTGEVNEPGVIELEEGARIQDAIEGAGGIKPEANLKDVNLAYEISDGEKIYIPNLLDETGEETEQTTSVTQSNSNGKVNINKATAAELTNIPGIGASTAEKIVVYRNENGKFKTIEDIKNVSGIGTNKYENIKDYISVK